jgi:hypothetical protein
VEELRQAPSAGVSCFSPLFHFWCFVKYEKKGRNKKRKIFFMMM